VLLRASWVLPITSPPLRDGAVRIDAGRIAAVAPAGDMPPEAGEPVLTFDGAALLPGLVNAHSHLELTVMRGLLEDMEFRPWIGRLTELKRNVLTTDDLLDSCRLGVVEALAAGVTATGDTCDCGLAVTALAEAGMRGVVYQEVFGPDPVDAAESEAKLLSKLEDLDARAAGSLVRVGLSPHAPYTVSHRLMGAMARLARDQNRPVAVHIAESAAEDEYVRYGSGAFADGLRARGIEVVADGMSPIAWLEETGMLNRAPLLIHCVRANTDDIERIWRSGSRVAHCPKSNAKFGHGIAPLAAMLRRGIVVGLGTDSVASNNVCDLLDEARAALLFARASSADAGAITARDALTLATLGGARALGLDGQVGSLEHGKAADLCVVDLQGVTAVPVFDVEAALVFSATAHNVVLTMIDGQVRYERGCGQFADRATSVMARARDIASRLEAAVAG
jgi:5-methylthioadenosine/S-adenosylhomocysteine deaminase